MSSSVAFLAYGSRGLRPKRAATNALAIGFLAFALGGHWAPVPHGCALPWDSIEQVERCGSAQFRPDETNKGVIWVTSREPQVIAGALAAAYNQREYGHTLVFAVSPEPPKVWGGGGLIRTDNGYWAEWTEGTIHFDVCTSWAQHDSAELCDDRVEFDVTR